MRYDAPGRPERFSRDVRDSGEGGGARVPAPGWGVFIFSDYECPEFVISNKWLDSRNRRDARSRSVRRRLPIYWILIASKPFQDDVPTLVG